MTDARASPLFQLYLTRLRDFYRQPARVFWVYGFPTFLAIVLGFAFQNRPPAPIQVDLVEGPARRRSRRRSRRTTPRWTAKQAAATRGERPRGRSSARPSRVRGLKRLNTGKTPLVDRAPRFASRGPTATTRRDPRPAAARQTIDDILQRAAGRQESRLSRRTSTSPSPAHGTSTS